MAARLCVYLGDALGQYQFGEDHPFGPHRYPAFVSEFERRGLRDRVTVCAPAEATEDNLKRFHTPEYIARVRKQSQTGSGYLDYGDTPAFPGVYEAAATVVGTTLDAVDRVMRGECARAFNPIGGLHHARRNEAAGFCVFNDCGVAIETLRRVHGVRRIGYVDIDAHHGDGVYYSFADDPELFIADIHEDGRFLYPGSGFAEERGQGAAQGTKLNIPLPPRADDALFQEAWARVEAFLSSHEPEFILFQCGADSLAGDPLTHLEFSDSAHRHAARRLRRLAHDRCGGRLVALGGGGYQPQNLARAWCGVVEALGGDRDAAPEL